LPGLFDLHVHPTNSIVPALGKRLSSTDHQGLLTIQAANNLTAALREGITTCRIPGEKHFVDIALRDAFNLEMLLGPNLIVAGPAITPTGGHGRASAISLEFDGADNIRTRVRELFRERVDFIKLFVSGGMGTASLGVSARQMTFLEIAAACEVAHFAGKKVAVHAGGSEVISDAVRAGIQCVEHAYEMNESTANLMAEHSVNLVPTLVVTQDKRRYEGESRPEWFMEKRKRAGVLHLESFQHALKAGTLIGAGSDWGSNNKEGIVRELELFVSNGMSGIEALRTATINAAHIAGVSPDLGSLEVGKIADILAVKADPRDPANLRDVVLVIAKGKIVTKNL
jgi:imidazolonepropionase-like amidohydrolase